MGVLPACVNAVLPTRMSGNFFLGTDMSQRIPAGAASHWPAQRTDSWRVSADSRPRRRKEYRLLVHGATGPDASDRPRRHAAPLIGAFSIWSSPLRGLTIHL